MNPLKNINLTFFFSALLLSNLSHAQATQIGLLCVAPGETPMIFKANLTNEASQYFSLSQSTWINFEYTEVRLNELILMPKQGTFTKNSLLNARGSKRGWWKVHIDRTNLQLFTTVTVDLDQNGTERAGSCTVHTYGEIDQIASREYSRLNNTRAF
jgi:hypothetical protein